MKKISAYLLILITLVGMFGTVTYVYASIDYTVLTPLPGTTAVAGCTGIDCKTDFTKYLWGAFNLSIAIAAVLAFVMITWGGITYATSDALAAKSEGREQIKNAIYGLLLAIGAWVILNTINPEIVNFSITLPAVQVASSSSALSAAVAERGSVWPGYTLSSSSVAINNQMRADLDTNYHVQVNAGPCINGEISGCTNLVGMPSNAFVGVTDLKTSCGTGCKVMITGGTEGGHLSHGPGQPKLDIANDPVLDAYIKNPANQTMRITNMPGYGDVYTVKLKNGQIVQFLEEGVGATGSSGAHWHANFLGP